jgi:hypothetical protein
VVSPAALTAFAHEHQVTEMLLARLTPAPVGHHLVLRELARTPGRPELHVLPAERCPERHRQSKTSGGSGGHDQGAVATVK